MKTDTWMPLYVADYRKKTARLTCEQHGAYLLLIMDYWVGGPLPDDDVALAQVACLGLREWKRMRPVIERYFIVRGREWLHERVEEERDRAQRLSAARRDAGSKGGRPRKQTESNEKPIGLAKANLEGSQTGLQIETPTRVALPSPPPDGGLEDADASSVPPQSAGPPAWRRDQHFVRAWEAATPVMRSRSDSREKTWPLWRRAAASAGGGEVLLAALEAYLAADQDVKRTGGPGFHLWLRDGKWEHWLPDGDSAPGLPPTKWPGPVEVRAAVVSAMGEAWARSWLDPCRWRDLPERAVLAHSDLAVERLSREVGNLLAGVGIEVRREAAA